MTRKTIFTFAVVLLFSGRSLADGWRPAPERQRQVIQLADSCGLVKASPRTVEMLNGKLHTSLTPDRVRLTSFTGERKFWNFIDGVNGQLGAKNFALGIAVTPHQGGPHPHLLVGDSYYDGIQPNWGRTFRDGTMMRKMGFGEALGSTSRIFAIWNAPQSSMRQVGTRAEREHVELRNTGKNCASFVTGALAEEGRNPGSPFADLAHQVLPRMAVPSVIKRNPDMLIQVVPEDSFSVIMGNHANHPIEFQH